MKYVMAMLLTSGLVAASTQPLNPQLPNTTEIRGRVFYANGKIASQALIHAFKEGHISGRIPMGNADNEGKFVIKGLQKGVEYWVCASKPDGYLIPIGLFFGLPTGGHCKTIVAGSVAEVNVTLAPKAGEIEGQVRGRNANLYLKGKVVVYRPLKLIRGEWKLVGPQEATFTPTAEALIDDRGHFKITGLPTGTYFLRVEIEGRKTWYFDNQFTDMSAQPIFIRAGSTQTLSLIIR